MKAHFTGAIRSQGIVRARSGRGGALLDEVETPLLQVKLLRVIQDDAVGSARVSDDPSSRRRIVLAEESMPIFANLCSGSTSSGVGFATTVSRREDIPLLAT